MAISKNDFRTLYTLCEMYDPFPQYIEDYNQYEAAIKANEACNKLFNETIAPYIPDYSLGVPDDCQNVRSAEDALKKWLQEQGLEIERRIWTEEEIKTLIQTNDKVLYGALKKLYAEQTADEQVAGETKHHNGVGFNGCDSKIMSSFAEFLNRTGFLTTKQKALARKKLVKYNKQLTRLANA